MNDFPFARGEELGFLGMCNGKGESAKKPG